MAVIKCKMCGGNLTLVEGSSIAECEYCGSTQTVPSADNEKKLALFNRANRLRFNCEFDKAAGVYEAIVADFPEEAEAYWGLVLCKYGIEYVDDPASGKKIPTCHRSSFDSVQDDGNFEQALENADISARNVYRAEAKAIEELRKGIIEVSSKEDPYDIFICYKESMDGERTIDSVLAQDIYDALTEKGYRVFFSRITLEDKLGQEYEPYIFAALNSAKVMLVVGTHYEHFNAVWVRNEWSRFLELIAKGKKKTLIPCFKGIDAYDMPKEFAKLQAQDLGKVGAVQDLLRGIDKLIDPATSASTQQAGIDVSGLLARGDQALAEGDWEAASNRYSLALVANAECAEAHVGQLKAERKVKAMEDLAKCKKPLSKSVHYKEALRCAGDALRETLEGYDREIKARRRIRGVVTAIAAVAITAAVAIGAMTGLENTYNTAVAQHEAGQNVSDMAYWLMSNLPGYKNSRNYAAGIAMSKSDPLSAIDLKPTRMVLNQSGLDTLIRVYDNYSWGETLNIELTDGVTEITDHAFNGKTALKEIMIPASVATIGNGAFQNCLNLRKVTIVGGNLTIYEGAFSGCVGLQKVSIIDGVQSIGPKAFSGCVALQEVAITGPVSVVGFKAFYGCSALSEITIPGPELSIGASAFGECIELKQVTFSDRVREIGDNAFANCVSLEMVNLPDGLELIDGAVFMNCTSLREIVIPGSAQYIYANTFSGCISLEKITIEEGVLTIGSDAFSDCNALKEVILPDGLEQIQAGAFRHCTSLEQISFPDSLEAINGQAFEDTALKAVFIPAGVKAVGAKVFTGCYDLEDIYCQATEKTNYWMSSWASGCSAEIHWGVKEDPTN